MNAVLAVDLGGSSLKACLFGVDGHVLGQAREMLSFEEDASGRSEQWPALWWQAFGRAVSRLLAQVDTSALQVSAICICGFTRTQVFVDANGEPTHPAIGFRDTRAGDVAHRAALNPAIAEFPQASALDAFHPLSRLLWLRQNHPKAWADTCVVLEPKDYLVLRLTERFAADAVSQHWLRTAFAGGDASLATALGFDAGILPELRQPWDVVGKVRAGLPDALAPLANALVLCGCNDTWTAVAGMGALRADHAYCISGSSEVVGLLGNRQATAAGLVTLPWGDGLWHIGGPGQNGSNVLTWIVDCLLPGERPLAERLEVLLAQPVEPAPLLFYPYLHGERTPFWDADLRGAFLGLGARHGPGDMVRAVMEGIAFVNRIVLERAEDAAATTAQRLHIAGGGARNAVWNQIRANVLGRPVEASAARELGLVGCLAVARVGLGLNADVVAAAQAVAQPAVCFLPDARESERLERLYEVFRDTHDAMALASHKLSAL